MRFLVWQDGWTVRSDLDREASRELALGPTPVWVRAEGVRMEDWDDVGAWFDLHPLALEDIRNPRQRPKVEDYSGVTFLVLRLPRLSDEGIRWTQVGVFLGDGYVMTASSEPVPELDGVEKRLIRSAPHNERLDGVVYHIVDAIIDAWFPYMDELEERLEQLEDSVLDSADQEHLRAIRDMKKLSSTTRKVLSPMREAALSLERSDHPGIAPDMRIFLRDVADHTIRLAERLEHVKEMALIAQETWNSTLANRQNEQMRRLTVVAGLLLVPGLLAGLGGMNFDGFPAWNYWTVTSAILAFIVVGFSVAGFKHWL